MRKPRLPRLVRSSPLHTCVRMGALWMRICEVWELQTKDSSRSWPILLQNEMGFSGSKYVRNWCSGNSLKQGTSQKCLVFPASPDRVLCPGWPWPTFVAQEKKTKQKQETKKLLDLERKDEMRCTCQGSVTPEWRGKMGPEGEHL